jgi:hypothetical protein
LIIEEWEIRRQIQVIFFEQFVNDTFGLLNALNIQWADVLVYFYGFFYSSVTYFCVSRKGRQACTLCPHFVVNKKVCLRSPGVAGIISDFLNNHSQNVMHFYLSHSAMISENASQLPCWLWHDLSIVKGQLLIFPSYFMVVSILSFHPVFHSVVSVQP